MSGHSKWHKIQHKKGVNDAKRGAIFTKLGNAITVAAKSGGGDPDMNFSLRLAIDKAKVGNMPKDNIERAIKRGTGELGGESLEQVIYEGFLPGQSLDGQKNSILIECLTDNKNRTVTDIKSILNKAGGSIVGSGSVMWQFQHLGVLTINKSQVTNLEDLELKIIDVGAEDFEIDEDEIIVYTKPENLQQVKENLDLSADEAGKQNIEIDSAELQFIAKDQVEISDETGEKIQKLFEQLDENDDVTNYFTNIK